ncbi:hypothetical protein U1Q18_005594 [Sarracenia purpurea var. burkii]
MLEQGPVRMIGEQISDPISDADMEIKYSGRCEAQIAVSKPSIEGQRSTLHKQSGDYGERDAILGTNMEDFNFQNPNSNTGKSFYGNSSNQAFDIPFSAKSWPIQKSKFSKSKLEGQDDTPY